MSAQLRKALLILLALGVLVAPALAGLLLCPRCGHEAESGAATCSHCGKALPASGEVVPAPAAPERPDPFPVSGQVVQGELAAIRAELEAGQAAQAWWRARNTAGLMALTPAEAGVDRGRADLEREALARVVRRERDCPVCRGEGTRVLLLVTVNGESTRQQAPGLKCPACSGSGRWPVRLSADQLEDNLGHARRAFDQAMRQAEWMEHQGLWLPPGSAPLTVRQQAACRKAMAGPCASCRGAGWVGCEDCAGAGRTVCPGSDCVFGRVLCPECGGSRRQRGAEDGRTLTRRCPSCQLTGVTDCPVCRGRACLGCETCSGRGEQTCSMCRGSGEKSLCTKCSGEGLRACSRCKGTGTYRQAACAECAGTGSVLCGACAGTGRGKR